MAKFLNLSSYFDRFITGCFTVSTGTMVIDRHVVTVLGHPYSTHGTKLWIRNVDDRATDLHETNLELRY